jgi:hypothetical protein
MGHPIKQAGYRFKSELLGLLCANVRLRITNLQHHPEIRIPIISTPLELRVLPIRLILVDLS